MLILDVHNYDAPGLLIGFGVAVLEDPSDLNILPEILVFQSGLHPSTPRFTGPGVQWRDCRLALEIASGLPACP